MELTQDLSALQGFIDETYDSMQDVETAILELEGDPTNPEIINTIFRPVHSMKGNSGFFGLTHINKFSHRLENLLDYIRNGEVVVDSHITNILLVGLDYLRKMLTRVEKDPANIEMRPEEEEFLVKQIEPCKPKAVAGSGGSLFEFEELLNQVKDHGADIHADSFLHNTFAEIERANQYLEKLLADLSHKPTLNTYDPEFDYSYNGEKCADQIRPVGCVLMALGETGAIEPELFEKFSKAFPVLKNILADQPEAQNILNELETVSNFFDDQLLIGNDQFNQNCRQLLSDLIGFFLPKEQEDSPAPRVGEILLDKGAINESDLEEALSLQQKCKAQEDLKQRAKTKNGKTIRINQSRLDSFANSIGDLYINIDAFNYLAKQLRQEKTSVETMTRFSKILTSLDEMVKTLQDNVMDIRRVPVRTLFQRFPRVIRELSTSLGKDVQFTITGDQTIIDKDLLEKIENPLVHLLRNSVDHGLELPAERLAADKPETGKLNLAAVVDEQYVHLTITDDGKGIDPQKIKQVALAKSFMSEDELSKLTDKKLINLIFKPGFSSAEKVSDVSGRGVGLDVVLSALKESNGHIDLESEVGQGTTIKLKIPLTKTLVTKDALIVRSAGQQFAIPSEDITITKYPEDNFVNLLTGEGGISFGGEVLRVIDMNHFFYAHPKEKLNRETRKVLVICQQEGVALLVDQVFSHQLIVMKDFAGGYVQFKDIPGVGGYTCLGNEEVVLIMDVKKMAVESLAGLGDTGQQAAKAEFVACAA